MSWKPFTPKLSRVLTLLLASGMWATLTYAQTSDYRFDVTSSSTFAVGLTLPDHTTYQVYVETANATDFVKRIYANESHPGAIAAPDGFYNTGGILGPFPNFIDNDWPGSYTGESVDSWVSIGLSEDANYNDNESNTLSNLGNLFDWSGTWASAFAPAPFPATNSGPVNLVANNAETAMEWFLNGPNPSISNFPSNGFAGDDNKVIVMQATTSGLFTFTLTAEIYVNGDPNELVTVTQTFNGTTEEPAIIEGCTDQGACNYYDLATADNGSCDYPSQTWRDCDEVCLNDADEDGICDEEEVVACNDASACNYNENWTEEGPCTYPEGCETCSGEVDGTGTVVDNDADDDGVCDANEISGCQDATACNYNESATDSDAGSCIYTDGVCESCSGATDGSGTIVDNDADDDGVCDADEIAGCQDVTACNYNADATDVGACLFPDLAQCEVCSGSTDGTGTILDGDADDDGICDADEIGGCTVTTACNYNAAATEDDGSCDYCSCGALTGLSEYALTIEEHAVDGIPGHTTYRIYVDVASPLDFVTSIFTLENGAMPFSLTSTATPNWYNFDDGFATYDFGATINPLFLSTFPEMAYDSWLTIGAADASEASGISFFTIGAEAAWAAFNAGEDVNISSTAGAFMIGLQPGCSRNPTAPNPCSVDHPAYGGDDHRVLLGQITTTGTLSGSLAVQILEDGVYTPGVYRTSYFSFNGVGSFSEEGFDGAMTSEYQNCGCTNSEAFNFNDEAQHDDGSCIAVVNGCMDETACNYDASANTDDASCTYVVEACEVCIDGAVVLLDEDGDGVCNDDEITGCTDDAACNFDNTPTTDTDNSLCIYPDGICEVCDGNGGVVVQDADGDQVCDGNEVAGCQDESACNYDASATDSDDSCVFADGNCEVCDGEGGVALQDADGDGVCDGDEVAGCQDASACNYDASATDSDGSCVFADGNCEVCDGAGGVAVQDADGDGICDGDEVAGCQDDTACNYDSTATDADDSCLYADGNCEVCDGEGGVTVQDADGDEVCDGNEVPGCTDDGACNYSGEATDDDGSCVFADDPCEICNSEGGVTVQDIDGDGVCDDDEVLGCMIAFACNYDVEATDDDGSCVFAVENCEICEEGAVALQDGDGDGICDGDEVVGCQDALACNYNESATDEGECLYATGCDICSGETDGSGQVLDGDTDDDGVCNVDEVTGCTDSAACNYDATPTTDADNTLCVYPEACDNCSGESDGSGVVVDGDSDNDGICDIDEIVGCTNPLACNYNEFATDNAFLSCEFPDDDTCEFCSGESDGTGSVMGGDTDGDGVCDVDEVSGCTDPTACNFDCDATDEDGSCTYASNGENCFGECLADTDGDGVCDANEVAGCADPSACNFVANATDEAACYFAAPGFDCQGECLADTDGDGVCDAYEVAGCTDPSAANYLAGATEDDGSCADQTLEEAYAEGYSAGYNQGFLDGDVNCTPGEDYCGEGTIWSEALGICVPESCVGDLDASGVIGTADLLIFLNVFGSTCE